MEEFCTIKEQIRPYINISPMKSFKSVGPPKSKKPILCLDLDETLVHSCDYVVNPNETSILKFLKVRNGVEQFLEEMHILYELVVFTSATKEYAKAVVQFIDTKKYISRVFNREHCRIINKYAVKDLSVVSNDLRRFILLDNSIVSFSMQLSNGI